jgi:glucose/arabinose dehydrogenase
MEEPMRKESLLVLGFASAVALAAVTPSFAATTHHKALVTTEPTSAYAQQHQGTAQQHQGTAQQYQVNAQAQQAKQCWIRAEMGENPNGNFGYWGSCNTATALPGR